MMAHNLHFPSMRVTIDMPLTLRPRGVQWCISDYDNTALEVKMYLNMLRNTMEKQRESIKQWGPEEYESYADRSNIPRPSVRTPVWGREMWKGSAIYNLYMPITLKDLPIIEATLKRERLNA